MLNFHAQSSEKLTKEPKQQAPMLLLLLLLLLLMLDDQTQRHCRLQMAADLAAASGCHQVTKS